jgi:hypothetical protein
MSSNSVSIKKKKTFKMKSSKSNSSLFSSSKQKTLKSSSYSSSSFKKTSKKSNFSKNSKIKFMFNGELFGPYYISIFKNIKGKNLVLFGEQHQKIKEWFKRKQVEKIYDIVLTRSGKIKKIKKRFPKDLDEGCFWFHNILLQIIKKIQDNNQCLDIYLEKSKHVLQTENEYFNFKRKKIKNFKSLEKINLSCLKPTKEGFEIRKYDYQYGSYLKWITKNYYHQCLQNQQNIRIHNFEIRSVYSDQYNFLDPLHDFLFYSNNLFEGEKYEGRIIKYLFTNNPKNKQWDNGELLEIKHVDFDDVWMVYADSPLENIYTYSLKIKDITVKNRNDFLESFSKTPLITKENFEDWFDYFMTLNKNSNYDNSYKLLIKQLNLYETILLSNDHTASLNSMKVEYGKNFKISNFKQFCHVRNIMHKQYLSFSTKKKEREFVLNKIKKIYIDHIFTNWSNILGRSTFMQLWSLGVFWSHMMSDVYMFFRIFRKWDIRKEKRSVKGCKGKNYQQKNILVYGGTNHTEILTKFIISALQPEKVEDFQENHKSQYKIYNEGESHSINIPEPIELI